MLTSLQKKIQPKSSDIELFEILVLSTMKYVVPRIQWTCNSKHYSKKMVQMLCDMPDTGTFGEYRKHFQREHQVMKKMNLTNGLFNNERRYVELAYSHVFDILNSLEKRFEGGTGTTYHIRRSK